MSYHVYVDGFLWTTVRSTDKTKALVEGVDNARVSNIMIIPLNPLHSMLKLGFPEAEIDPKKYKRLGSRLR